MGKHFTFYMNLTYIKKIIIIVKRIMRKYFLQKSLFYSFVFLFFSNFVSAQVLVKPLGIYNYQFSNDQITFVGNKFFFTSYYVDSIYKLPELWVSDGTSDGTFMLKDYVDGIEGSSPQNLTEINGKLYYTAIQANGNTELYVSDGTINGTHLLKDINLNPSKSSGVSSLTNCNGVLYFSANDDIHGYEVWKSDGTEAGTVMLKDIYPGSVGSGNPAYGGPTSPSAHKSFIYYNGFTYFAAQENESTGVELWRTDGTELGTTLVKDISMGSNSSFPLQKEKIIFNNYLYFTCLNGEIWKTDGTSNGTVLVKDLGIDPNPTNFKVVNNSLFFTARFEDNNCLFKSDGSSDGTILLHNFEWTLLDYMYMTDYKNTLYFSAYTNSDNNNNHFYGLWKSDGTEIGTKIVCENFDYNSNGLSPSYLIVSNDSLYYSAKSPDYGFELWRSNGDYKGATMVVDLVKGVNSSTPRRLFNFNGAIYYFGNVDTLGGGLLKYVVAESSTKTIDNFNVKTINPYPNPSCGFFTFEFEKLISGDLKIYNLLGETVYSETVINKTRIDVNIANEPSGAYTFQLTSNEGEITNMLIKK